jgi:hypothetical protein
MTFLPIVERELRIAARKRGTFWLRVAAALVGIVLAIGVFLLTEVKSAAGFGTANFGGDLFGVLTWLALAAALAAGLFFTSDCLSEEKREGTLGFLFLTDLRGYDVAGGKLLVTSLRASYAFLAMLPILGMCLLLGGVTPAQFWKTSLALFNALFCSLATGLFVSAISRDSQKALAGTFLLLLTLTFGGPVGDSILAGMNSRSFSPRLSLSSPGYLFIAAGALARVPYWIGLLFNQAVAWILFALACMLVPRTWQQKAVKREPAKSWAYALKYGGARRRAVLRKKLVEPNPILWLACRERWQALGVWLMALVASTAFVLPLAFDLPRQTWMIGTYVGGLFSLGLYLWAASQASRFLIEARRSGLIELLMAAPVSTEQIVRGQWRALLRMFGLPVLLIVGIQMAAAALAHVATWGQFATGGPQVSFALVAAAAGSITTLGNLIALSWFGMWMGMTSKNTSLAALKTFAFVEVIPWLVIAYASAMVVSLLMMPALLKGASGGKGPPTGFLTWYPLLSAVLAGVLALAKDIAFSLWARKKLYSSFREQLVRNAPVIRAAVLPLSPQGASGAAGNSRLYLNR